LRGSAGDVLMRRVCRLCTRWATYNRAEEKFDACGRMLDEGIVALAA